MTTDTSAEALEESIFWLKAKYRRHGEIEDRIAAEQLEYFQAEKRRAREGVTDDVVDRCAKIILSEYATPESQPTFFRDIRAALEAAIPILESNLDSVYKRLLKEAQEHHLACIKDAYSLLGIDGSDGEYRYKWVALELAKRASLQIQNKPDGRDEEDSDHD